MDKLFSTAIRKYLSFLIILGLITSVASLAHAITYTFTTIDYPGALNTGASGINDSGQIVGNYYADATGTHGFLYAGGIFTTIGGEANGINNSGDIVGCPFLNYPGANYTCAQGINDSGDIVGYYFNGVASYGFLYARGTFNTIDFPSGCVVTRSGAYGINDSGDIVCSECYSFLDVNGHFTMIDFPAAYSAEDIYARGINNSGDIVGFYEDATHHNTHGFLDVGGSITTLDVPGATNIPFQTYAYGINNADQIVGEYADALGNTHGFLATPSGIISTPTTPSGPASGVMGTSYSYSTGGSTSSLANSVEYQFDWKGDSSDLSNWGSGIQSKTWTTAGIYNVRARARSVPNVSVMSGWSNPLTVTINAIGPDLTGSWTIPLTQTCKTIGKKQRCTLKGTVTVSNTGTRDASSTYVGFYLSDDQTYDETDTPLKSFATGKLKTGKSKLIRFNYNLPVGQTATGKYIIAVIDKDNLLTEIDKNNNIILFGPIQ